MSKWHSDEKLSVIGTGELSLFLGIKSVGLITFFLHDCDHSTIYLPFRNLARSATFDQCEDVCFETDCYGNASAP